MDEAEKYQQRLQAIAEKRRLQEEQERARREMEDERLRLQQLKRKSLRDQWLMEGPALSPTSLDGQSPESPLWDAKDNEKHMDKLQTESHCLAVKEEKHKEQMDDGQTEAAEVAEPGEAAWQQMKIQTIPVTDGVQGAVVQNGQDKGTEPVDAIEDTVKKTLFPELDETAAVLTNGDREGQAEANHDALEENILPSIDGPTGAHDGAVTMTFLGFSEAEPNQVPSVVIDEKREEVEPLLMRAERVIITDEGEDVPEDHSLKVERVEVRQLDDAPQPNSDTPTEEGGEMAKEEEVVKSEAGSETSTEPKEDLQSSEAISATAREDEATRDGEMTGDIQSNESPTYIASSENGDGEGEAEGDKTEVVSEQLQPSVDALEGATVASVPVYSEGPPPSLSSRAEAENEPEGVQSCEQAAAAPEEAATEGEEDAKATGAEEAVIAPIPAALPGQFQEISLADPQENQRTESGPGEEQPLLCEAKAPQTQAETKEGNSPTNTERHVPNRGGPGEEPVTPKRKTCQCCSVM
ncbi:paralemmin-3 [Lampris incognitus]|uniref:paralemmin-3 n=1 Tax=Lampris incognitus TaxID=2546036 RepID=UPI0024B4F6C5|nr:paralemmin-3 [Lampris incognitus]XP_056136336.1 paralemmin-3 [Lampris incognitus]